jgi:hypothetical protein
MWEQLDLILSTQAQRDSLPHGVPFAFNYFGIIVAGGGSKTAKTDWDNCFVILLAEENVISNITRSKLTLVSPGEDENSTPNTQEE